jgi:DNA-binding LytR/AlgR family response regulator
LSLGERHLAWLHVGAGSTTRALSVAEVLYFKAADKYTDVVTAAERHMIRSSLKELTQQLDPRQCLRRPIPTDVKFTLPSDNLKLL